MSKLVTCSLDFYRILKVGFAWALARENSCLEPQMVVILK